MVVRLYPYTNLSSGRFRKRVVYDTGRGDQRIRSGGRFNGQGDITGRGGEAGEVDEYPAEKFTEKEAVYIKILFAYQTSPVNLKMQSGTHSQTRQRKG